VPSKTFHIGPESLEVLVYLFESHLLLTSLLEASTGIGAGDPDSVPFVRRAIADADNRWVAVLRQHWPPSETVT
jgi:hypothetical protein